MENNRETRLSAVLLALAQRPAGRVISYGELARQAGLPGRARQVGKILSQLPEATQLPWHRVVNAQGQISLPPASEAYRLQVQRLEAEGVRVNNGRINLRSFGWLTP